MRVGRGPCIYNLLTYIRLHHVKLSISDYFFFVLQNWWFHMVQLNTTLRVRVHRGFIAGDQKFLVSIVKLVLSYLVITSPSQIISLEGGDFSF